MLSPFFSWIQQKQWFPTCTAVPISANIASKMLSTSNIRITNMPNAIENEDGKMKIGGYCAYFQWNWVLNWCDWFRIFRIDTHHSDWHWMTFRGVVGDALRLRYSSNLFFSHFLTATDTNSKSFFDLITRLGFKFNFKANSNEIQNNTHSVRVPRAHTSD